MECNKDEAARAKEIAEKKFRMKDIEGAKKFALKAQSLYPEVEGISQMLATLDVYIASENKVNGEADWYGILNATPRDDDETMKRKYRKLALLLHPDKNKSFGAEGAFQHVSEAWNFLSDKEKRAAYDRRKSLQTVYQKVSVSANRGFCNFAKANFTASNVRTQKNNAQKPGVSATKGSPHTQKTGRTDHYTTPNSFTASGSSNQSKSNTFWTICRRCMMQYEYLRDYVNHSLLCPNCRQSFSAIEVPQPGVTSHWSFSRLKHSLDQKSAAKWKFSRSSSAAHAASVVQQAYEKVKKEREEAKASARREEYLRKKNGKRKSTDPDPSADNSLRKRRRVIGEIGVGCNGSKVTYNVSGENGKLYGSGSGSMCGGASDAVKMNENKEIAEEPSGGIQIPLTEISNGVTREIKTR